MKRIPHFVVVITLMTVCMPLHVAALSEDILMLSEVKVKNTSSTQADEFVELYNNGLTDINLKNYYLEYFNVADPLSQTVTTHKGPFVLPDLVMSAGSTVLLAISPANVPGSIKLDSITSLKDSEGQIRLLKLNNLAAGTYDLVDNLAWKDAAILPVNIYAVPALGSASLQRLTHSEDKPYAFDVGWTSDVATPGVQYFIALPPTPDPEPDPTPTPDTPDPNPTPDPDDTQVITDPDPSTDPITPGVTIPESAALEPTLLSPQITELMPNPLPPQTDSTDEYVELYNPNNEALDLDEFQLQTGTSFSYKTTLHGLTIAPHGYVVISSSDTNLSLANTGGNARIVRANGEVVATISAYDTAPEGQAWAFINGNWQWTTTSTPAAENILTQATTILTAKTTAKKVSAVKAASTKKPSIIATKKTATTKALPSTSNADNTFDDAEPVTPLHPSVIAGISLLALLYAGYEYRFDFTNKLYQFKRYREARRTRRLAT